jgi:hypothetical protein
MSFAISCSSIEDEAEFRPGGDDQQLWVTASRQFGTGSIARFKRDLELSAGAGSVPRSGSGASGGEGSSAGWGEKIQGGGEGGLNVGSCGGPSCSCSCALHRLQQLDTATASTTTLAQLMAMPCTYRAMLSQRGSLASRSRPSLAICMGQELPSN